jgi:hypothetical protein
MKNLPSYEAPSWLVSQAAQHAPIFREALLREHLKHVHQLSRGDPDSRVNHVHDD